MVKKILKSQGLQKCTAIILDDSELRRTFYVTLVGLLCLAISPLFIWIRILTGGMLGLEFGGIYIVIVSPILIALLLGGSYRRKLLLETIFLAMTYSLLTFVWVVGIFIQIGTKSSVSSPADNPLFQMLATQFGAGIGLYLALFSSLVSFLSTGNIVLRITSVLGHRAYRVPLAACVSVVLLGVVISAERDRGEIAQETPESSPDTAETEAKAISLPLIDITPEEIMAKFLDDDSKLTGLQKADLWDHDYNGKRVQWTATVNSVEEIRASASSERVIVLYASIDLGKTDLVLVDVSLSSDQRKAALTLRKELSVMFSGVLVEYKAADELSRTRRIHSVSLEFGMIEKIGVAEKGSAEIASGLSVSYDKAVQGLEQDFDIKQFDEQEPYYRHAGYSKDYNSYLTLWGPDVNLTGGMLQFKMASEASSALVNRFLKNLAPDCNGESIVEWISENQSSLIDQGQSASVECTGYKIVLRLDSEPMEPMPDVKLSLKLFRGMEADPEQFDLRLRRLDKDNGFRQMKFGSVVDESEGMMEIAGSFRLRNLQLTGDLNSSNEIVLRNGAKSMQLTWRQDEAKDWKNYIKSNEILTWGRASIGDVIYSFYDSKLAEIFIFIDPNEYPMLRREMSALYGDVFTVVVGMHSNFGWMGAVVNIDVSHYEDLQLQVLEMTSGNVPHGSKSE